MSRDWMISVARDVLAGVDAEIAKAESVVSAKAGTTEAIEWQGLVDDLRAIRIRLGFLIDRATRHAESEVADA